MSQSDDTKTKLFNPMPQRNADDATLIAPSERGAPQSSPDDRDDKTVLGAEYASPLIDRVDDGDATQFAAFPPDDATRLQHADAASVAQPSRSRVSSQPFNHDSHLRVLKERFVLERVLGAGGMGVVYKAKDLVKVKANDRDPYIAIKVLSEEFKSHPESFMALQRESRKTQRIAHPNIVTVYDFDEDGDTVFMTMEYMEGKPLDKLIKQYSVTGLPSDDIWEILRGMCAALINAHGEHIIHSDFKPGNVFVTTRGTAKVFDFGIARAVAQADHMVEKGGERTLFDAGNLGALTPAYASLEMLEGEEPDPRDDIYALGCVVYELFTGRHPFGKLSAVDACKNKLKPKPIKGLNKWQRRAVARALAFRRADRMATVAEFRHEMIARVQRSYLPALTVAALAAVAGAAYWQLYIANPPEPEEPAMPVEAVHPNAADIEYHKDRITRLLDKATFTSAWEEDLWDQVQSLRALVPADDEWRVAAEAQIIARYLDQIQSHIAAGRYSRATALLDNAYRYAVDTALLDRERSTIARLRQEAEEGRKQVELARQREQQRRAAAARQAERQRAAVLAEEQQQAQEQQRLESFEAALDNVRNQLACRDGLNIRNIETAVVKLRELDATRYQALEPEFIRAAVSCIQTIGQDAPERAQELKRQALRLFEGHSAIAAITIVPRDACDLSIAGLGSRGARAWCRDYIDGVGQGPRLVVIPARRSAGIEAFAVGKYEVSIEEFNLFCRNTGQCRQLAAIDPDLPATNIPIKTVRDYLSWLSKKTQRTYRLPTEAEWRYAAQSVIVFEDPNRNCTLKTRSLNKGIGLVKVGTGGQNGWGLVNYVGNAQEWVYTGRKLVAVGGAYSDHISECTITTTRSHSGAADKLTGFRVLRELQEGSL